MHFHKNIFLVIVLISIAAVFAAEQENLPVDKPSVEGGPEKLPALPYVAEITAGDVLARSGAGTEYYPCTKLNQGDRVTVVSHKTVWSAIVPPANAFSWISVSHVKVDPNNPSTGMVTGGTARVYAGSEQREPMHSEVLQVTLNDGSTVKLMGEQKDDYYKIIPPSGVYLWVNTSYTRPVAITETDTKPQPTVKLPPQPKIVQNTKPVPEIPTVTPTQTSVEQQSLERYRQIEKQIEQEKQKPLSQQDYEQIKKSLAGIADDKNAGKAARYAKFTLDRIKDIELAKQVEKTVKLQDIEAQKVKKQIETAKEEKLKQVTDLGRFAVIGQLKPSQVYEVKHWRIVDQDGKTICYALPTEEARQIDMEKFTDKKVGLIGTIKPHQQTSGVLVEFSQIEQISQ